MRKLFPCSEIYFYPIRPGFIFITIRYRTTNRIIDFRLLEVIFPLHKLGKKLLITEILRTNYSIEIFGKYFCFLSKISQPKMTTAVHETMRGWILQKCQNYLDLNIPPG